MLWLGVAYLGALAALFITALWTANGFTGNIERTWTLDNFRELFSLEVYRTITIRTLLTAVGVTVIDAVIAFPVALYMAKVASPRAQRLLVIAILDAAVGVVPREGVRLARHVLQQWPHRLAAVAVRAQLARLRAVRDGGDAVLPVAPVHDPADVRRPRTAAELPAGGVGRPRRGRGC